MLKEIESKICGLEKRSTFSTRRWLLDNLPQPVIVFAKLIIYTATMPFNYAYDFLRYQYYSASMLFWRESENLRGMVMKDCHRLEKGMALPYPRPGFGQKVATRLAHYTGVFVERFGRDDVSDMSLAILRAYLEFHRSRGLELEQISHQVDLIASKNDPSDLKYCLKKIDRDSLEESTSIDFLKFVNSRSSMRQFSGDKVPRELIDNAVTAAIKTPSVCNRQMWRIHVYENNSSFAPILGLQTGNRGFGERASHIAIITADLRYFEGPEERNQAYVEGGLFAMTLVYALHAQRVGTCFLNWSAPMVRDIVMHKKAKIPANEVIIALLAIGTIPAEFEVASSPRRDMNTVLRWHD